MLELAPTLLFHRIKRDVTIIHRYDAFTILYDFRSACPVSRRGYSSFALENDKLESKPELQIIPSC